ncbi:response regulator [Paenibacillus sp. KS-LC4]|uniref:response regulator n=1 Tax=Paenibacillus sp. KS-LC4 TaxID=2979727 RepID=UPI0030CC128C
MLQAYLVDDELHALNILDIFLARTGKVTVEGRYINGFEALEALRNKRPHIWFLDIEMPEMSGLELAAYINEADPDAAIVFTTAYDHYAIAAFEHEAIDYLLKPIEMDRLSRTIERLTREKNARRPFEAHDLEAGCKEELDVHMLGILQAQSASGKQLIWRTAKEKELFAYLLLNGYTTTGVHRDRIIASIWPDEPYEKAKVYLHTCISLLRKGLRQIGIEQLVSFQNEQYSLDMKRIKADVFAIITAPLELAHPAEASIAQLEQALQLHEQELLAQEDYAWAADWRQRLEHLSVEWLLKLSSHYLAQNNGRKAAEYAERAIRHSPYEEEAYRCAMHAYMFMGEHHQVHCVYRKLTEQLGELNIQPSALSRQLYEQIEA